jgi:sugar phosphate isomerase/epimerase
MPMTAAQWVKVMPAGYHWPKTPEELARLSDKEKAEMKLQMGTALLQLRREDLTMTADGQVLRVDKEADRIRRLEELAKPYGCMVELYNHNGWLGMAENQLAVIEKLRQLGVNDVGMVYNFSHSRDELHDDSANFPALWRKIEFHVVNVNITGMHMDGDYIYPSQGNGELEMMRTIQESGWNGTVGLDAEKGLDAQITLQNYLRGLDWIAAELKQAGSAGPRPLFQPP